METRIGEWYLCEGYIDEPVRVETLDPGRIQVRYLTTGRIRWLGYPRIWQACRPQPLSCEVDFDARDRVVVLQTPDSDAPLLLSLAQLRARVFPHAARPRRSPQKAPQPVADTAEPAWAGEVRVETSLEDVADDDDETDLELDMGY